jgi:hypothetical protein
MLLKRINVKKGERVIVTKNGRFAAILTPGSHLLFVPPMVSLGIESYDLQSPVLGSRWTRFFLQNRPDIISAHFTLIETSDSQIAMVSIDGSLHQVLLPGKRMLIWKDGPPVTVEVVNIIDSVELPTSMLIPLERLGYRADYDDPIDDSDPVSETLPES